MSSPSHSPPNAEPLPKHDPHQERAGRASSGAASVGTPNSPDGGNSSAVDCTKIAGDTDDIRANGPGYTGQLEFGPARFSEVTVDFGVFVAIVRTLPFHHTRVNMCTIAQSLIVRERIVRSRLLCREGCSSCLITAFISSATTVDLLRRKILNAITTRTQSNKLSDSLTDATLSFGNGDGLSCASQATRLCKLDQLRTELSAAKRLILEGRSRGASERLSHK
jgi:hypothetical protein